MRYENRVQEMEAGILAGRLHHTVAVIVLAVAVALFLILGVYTIKQKSSLWWLSLPVTCSVVAARRYRQIHRSKLRMSRLRCFYERAVERMRGNWVGSGVTGEEFRDSDHVYENALHIFGEGSLFELLCIARTSIGQQGLADYLLEAPVPEETLLRQEAIRELKGRVDLRERIASLGDFEFLESKWSTLRELVAHASVSIFAASPCINRHHISITCCDFLSRHYRADIVDQRSSLDSSPGCIPFCRRPSVQKPG